jgi:hypothetical protein
MANYREEERFTIRLELSAEFGDDYEGDDDGYAWLEAWKARVRPNLVCAVFDALRSDAGFDVLPTSRGASPDRELEITVRRKVAPHTRPQLAVAVKLSPSSSKSSDERS